MWLINRRQEIILLGLSHHKITMRHRSINHQDIPREWIHMPKITGMPHLNNIIQWVVKIIQLLMIPIAHQCQHIWNSRPPMILTALLCLLTWSSRRHPSLLAWLDPSSSSQDSFLPVKQQSKHRVRALIRIPAA